MLCLADFFKIKMLLILENIVDFFVNLYYNEINCSTKKHKEIYPIWQSNAEMNIQPS